MIRTTYGTYGFCLAVWFFAITARAFAAQEAEPRIQVDISHQKVYEGQSIRYSITLENLENPAPPDLSGLSDFDVQFLGERSLDSSSITIIQGRMTQIVRRGREYQYELTPTKTGRLVIPGPTAPVDGGQLVGPERILEVVPADQQDIVRMDIEVDRAVVYPTQPFHVTLAIAIKGLPAPVDSRSPLGVQDMPPKLQIPWILDENLPDGLEPEMDWQQWIEPMRSRTREGFQINHIGDSSISFFFQERLLRFNPPSEQVALPDKDGNQTTYWKYEITRAFVAKKVGVYRFGPASVQGVFGTKLTGGDRLVGDEIYALAQPVEVTIRDVPPPTGDEAKFYTGAIGKFDWKGDLKPKQAKVGDPITLTLTLTGEGTLQSIAAPDLNQIPEIADHFRIYEATEESNRNRCQFTYSLRPTDTAITTFPGIPMVSFDCDQEQFVTLLTDPIPIQVTEADRRGGEQVISGQRSGTSGNRPLESRREGIVGNITDWKAVRNETVHPMRWLAGLAGLVVLYAVIALVTTQIRRMAGDTVFLRRRGAPARARRRMREVRSQSDPNRPRDVADPIRNILCGFVADIANVPDAGLTPKDTERALVHMGLDPERAGRFCQLLEQCDAAQYGDIGQDVGSLGREAEMLLEDTISELKQRKLI